MLVDNVQQNQGTQGHGQGYLGQLKALTPELVQNVEIVNGPFSTEYGDFSGLGVVHIRLKESLGDQLTARVQGGSFDTVRSFLGYSPQLKSGVALLAYELSRSAGPFKNPLRYKRDNATGNYIRNLSEWSEWSRHLSRSVRQMTAPLLGALHCYQCLPIPSPLRCAAAPWKLLLLHTYGRSKRSRVITLAHAFTKSCTNFSFPSDAA